jgi:hypothetical protein
VTDPIHHNPGNPVAASHRTDHADTGIELGYLEVVHFWRGVGFGLLISVPLWTVLVGGIWLIFGGFV